MNAEEMAQAAFNAGQARIKKLQTRGEGQIYDYTKDHKMIADKLKTHQFG